MFKFSKCSFSFKCTCIFIQESMRIYNTGPSKHPNPNVRVSELTFTNVCIHECSYERSLPFTNVHSIFFYNFLIWKFFQQIYIFEKIITIKGKRGLGVLGEIDKSFPQLVDFNFD